VKSQIDEEAEEEEELKEEGEEPEAGSPKPAAEPEVAPPEAPAAEEEGRTQIYVVAECSGCVMQISVAVETVANLSVLIF